MRRDEDCLVQLTFHFPKVLHDDDDDVSNDDVDADDSESKQADSKAEEFQKLIMDTGAIDSTSGSGSTIVEFSKEEANFVSPRGRYIVQVYLYLYMTHLQLLFV